MTEEDIELASAELEIAQENWYAAAARVRACPECSGGWRIKRYYDAEGEIWREGAFECTCRGREESKALMAAKQNYRRTTGDEPPPSDVTRSSYY